MTVRGNILIINFISFTLYFTGLIILFDGQKQYPQVKASVDYLFVEHIQHNCIEIIGTCVPTVLTSNTNSNTNTNSANTGNNSSGNSVGNNNNIGNSNSSSNNSSSGSGLSVQSQNSTLQTVRMFVSAKIFYEKVINDKKAKDKKNRRAEQAMTQGSKLTQNMAVTVLLSLLHVTQNPIPKNRTNVQNENRIFAINIGALDGLKFECEKPKDETFVPFSLIEKAEKDKERINHRRFSANELIQVPTELSLSAVAYLAASSTNSAINSRLNSGKEENNTVIANTVSNNTVGSSKTTSDNNSGKGSVQGSADAVHKGIKLTVQCELDGEVKLLQHLCVRRPVFSMVSI